ncbi:MAG: tRNA uridine-5-carboxymethylaminomethyl(34) synthesis GTPase MnmE [Gammaproteobacteria bacterium]|nr:tRNA uridine-5-carboxymethylaminomethyl(34) synthesis GTPase MnmE [Gammaproteobacteria bacterium]
MTITDTDTICAIATPLGRSGVGIVRISGPDCQRLSRQILGFDPKPRKAYFTEFHGPDSSIVDRGIAIYFKAPNSFTGEDILELQGHGGIFILNSILKSVLDMGCRIARPGEFSERSFINNKMDLAQVEAIADLINANTEQAAKSAFRTLEGAFSQRINELVASITELRVYLEAAIDFTDEDIDFISEGNTVEKLQTIIDQTEAVFKQARVGAILQEGIKVAIAGRPNAGKSSLLNSLSGRETAIVTDIPGTTRDTLKELIDVDGIPVHIIDTAGLRQSTDVVEQEGVRRAREVIENADLVMLVADSQLMQDESGVLDQHFAETQLPEQTLEAGRLLVVYNKIDLLESDRQPSLPFSTLDRSLDRSLDSSQDSSLDSSQENTRNSSKFIAQVMIMGRQVPSVMVSAKTDAGIDQLREQIKNMVGYTASEEGSFSARERHIRALRSACTALETANSQLLGRGNLELVAEDLRQAQNFLGEITGQVTSDDLLGQIFSTFCIGK